ncbi:excitatory amino acid transporter 5-like [Takifugu flavidus]|nr:excitatory amino acid transporter 5-like [Takifugu flavidus]TWW54765.1 Excitatory amino acid transporter 5 [Takifugu flavidus]
MVIVLTSVGLPPADISLIVAIDWVLDRFRTMINVLGDALAAGIMAHLCKKDFDKTSNGTVVNTPPPANDQRRDTVISFGNQSVALSDAPLIAHRCDYIFEVDGENMMERPVACYNLCQV